MTSRYILLYIPRNDFVIFVIFDVQIESENDHPFIQVIHDVKAKDLLFVKPVEPQSVSQLGSRHLKGSSFHDLSMQLESGKMR